MNLYVKRSGNVCTVFVEPASSRPLPIASYEDEPVGGFPMTFRLPELQARFPGYNYVFVEEKRPPQPEAVSSTTDEEILREVPEAREKLALDAARFKDGVPAPKPAAMATPPSYTQDLEDEALYCFREMIRAWYYAKGREKKELARDIEAVASFLIQLRPQLEGVLERIKTEETLEKKRFSLGG